MHIAHLFDQRYGKPRVLRDNLRRNLLKQLASASVSVSVSVSVSGVCVCVGAGVCVSACMWLCVCAKTVFAELCRRGRCYGLRIVQRCFPRKT